MCKHLLLCVCSSNLYSSQVISEVKRLTLLANLATSCPSISCRVHVRYLCFILLYVIVQQPQQLVILAILQVQLSKISATWADEHVMHEGVLLACTNAAGYMVNDGKLSSCHGKNCVSTYFQAVLAADLLAIPPTLHRHSALRAIVLPAVSMAQTEQMLHAFHRHGSERQLRCTPNMQPCCPSVRSMTLFAVHISNNLESSLIALHIAFASGGNFWQSDAAVYKKRSVSRCD